jgi:hypothetical protein
MIESQSGVIQEQNDRIQKFETTSKEHAMKMVRFKEQMMTQNSQHREVLTDFHHLAVLQQMSSSQPSQLDTSSSRLSTMKFKAIQLS